MTDIKFFLGANSDIGFKSYFKQLQAKTNGLQLLILKGGAGSGKSSLMKRVMLFAKEKEHFLEIIPCASDPNSLDAVIDHTQKFAIMDGTSPHVLDPDLAGINSHIIYTGDLWDIGELRSRKDEAEPLAEKISDCHKSAAACIKSASALLRENMDYGEKFINRKNADLLAEKIMNEAFTKDEGCEKTRLLSAVSVGETVLFEKTPFLLCDKVYVICDKFGAASNYLNGKILRSAREKKQDFIHCPCSIVSGKCDHLIFPKSRVAVVSQNDFLVFPDGEKINSDELYSDIPLLSYMEKRLSAAKEILPLAEDAVSEAKALHDALEKYYVSAMDFSRMDGIFNKILYHFYDQFPQTY